MSDALCRIATELAANWGFKTNSPLQQRMVQDIQATLRAIYTDCATIAEAHECDTGRTDDHEWFEHCGEAELCGSVIADALRKEANP